MNRLPLLELNERVRVRVSKPFFPRELQARVYAYSHTENWIDVYQDGTMPWAKLRVTFDNLLSPREDWYPDVSQT